MVIMTDASTAEAAVKRSSGRAEALQATCGSQQQLLGKLRVLSAAVSYKCGESKTEGGHAIGGICATSAKGPAIRAQQPDHLAGEEKTPQSRLSTE